MSRTLSTIKTEAKERRCNNVYRVRQTTRMMAKMRIIMAVPDDAETAMTSTSGKATTRNTSETHNHCYSTFKHNETPVYYKISLVNLLTSTATWTSVSSHYQMKSREFGGFCWHLGIACAANPTVERSCNKNYVLLYAKVLFNIDKRNYSIKIGLTLFLRSVQSSGFLSCSVMLERDIA